MQHASSWRCQRPGGAPRTGPSSEVSLLRVLCGPCALPLHTKEQPMKWEPRWWRGARGALGWGRADSNPSPKPQGTGSLLATGQQPPGAPKGTSWHPEHLQAGWGLDGNSSAGHPGWVKTGWGAGAVGDVACTGGTGLDLAGSSWGRGWEGFQQTLSFSEPGLSNGPQQHRFNELPVPRGKVRPCPGRRQPDPRQTRGSSRAPGQRTRSCSARSGPSRQVLPLVGAQVPPRRPCSRPPPACGSTTSLRNHREQMPGPRSRQCPYSTKPQAGTLSGARRSVRSFCSMVKPSQLASLPSLGRGWA